MFKRSGHVHCHLKQNEHITTYMDHVWCVWCVSVCGVSLCVFCFSCFKSMMCMTCRWQQFCDSAGSNLQFCTGPNGPIAGSPRELWSESKGWVVNNHIKSCCVCMVIILFSKALFENCSSKVLVYSIYTCSISIENCLILICIEFAF